MKKLLLLFSLLITSITFTIQAGRDALIDENKTKSYSPIQKFLSFFACAAPEKEAPKIHYSPTIKPEEPEIILAPEDIDYDLLGSSAARTAQLEKEVSMTTHFPATQEEISTQPIEDKNITALLNSFEARSRDKKKMQQSAKVSVTIEPPSQSK